MSDIKKDPYLCCSVIDHKKSDAGLQFELRDGQHVVVWNVPFRVRAQTVFDMDYRKEWNGDEIVYEGNNYSDTTAFYIIGNVI